MFSNVLENESYHDIFLYAYTSADHEAYILSS